MVTEQEENSLGYLLDPAFQLVNSNGKPLTDGWIECYIHGTRNKYYCYSDWNGNLHPFRVPIDSIGSNVVLADPNRAYDVYVYNKYGTLIMSRYNVSPGHASGASVGGSGDAGHWIARLGSTTTAPKNQYSTSIPIPANPDYEGNFVDRINGNNIYLKEGVYLVDAILRFRQNPDDLSNTFGDIHVFTGVDDSETVVYNRNETGPDADETDYHQIRVQFVRHVTGNTDDVVCFQVKSTNALSWIQIQNLSIVKLGGGSGIAPQPVEYSAGQYISIDNDTISVTGLQPSGNYATVESVSQGFYGVAQQINTLSGAIDDVAGSIPSIEGLASEQYVDEHIEEAVSGKADRSEIPSLEGYATETYVQSQVSGKADKSEIPSLDGYATETYVQSSVSGKQDELEFTYDSENKITSIDGHGIAGTGGGGGGGSSYIPGQYIKIQNDVISVTGLQPSGDYQPAGDYLTQDDLNGYATTEDVEAAVSGKADKSEIPSVAGLASEQYVDEHITEATSGKADVSAIPSLAGYATESWVNEQGFLKEVPQEFVTDSELNSAISGKADKSEIPSVAGLASETYVNEHINEATSGKMDKSQSADFYPMASNPSGYLTQHQSLAGYATQEWVNQQGFADDDDVRAATSGKMDASAYTAPVNADWSATSGLSQILNKPETEEMDIEELQAGEYISIQSGVISVTGLSGSGGGSTYSAGQYISIQNDVIAATGLQPAGEYLVPSDLNGYATTEDVEAATSGKLDASAYTAPVNADWSATSGLSEILNKPEASQLLAGPGISITESGTDYVISSTGGGSVPEGVMSTSGLQYNAVGEISGYGDSAIAQYGAEKQWLVHDDTIVHMSNSAQYAFGVNISATSQLMGVDETVLYESSGTSAANISEDLHNFSTAQLHLKHGSYGPAQVYTLNPSTMNTSGYFAIVRPRGSENLNVAYLRFEVNASQLKCVNSKCIRFGGWNNTTITASDVVLNDPEDRNAIIKVVGIGRKQST